MKLYKTFDGSVQPIEWFPGTNQESFAVGQVLNLSSGALTAADDDSDGTQAFIGLSAGTGDGSTLMPVQRIRATDQYKTTSSGQIAASALGSKYTLASTELTITATTTNGVFEVDETDGATYSTVVGHFPSAI
jgi:hypothetical protein